MTMRRHRKADTIFRSKFGIPEGELFLDEYHCALQKKMLIQARAQSLARPTPSRARGARPRAARLFSLLRTHARPARPRVQGRMYIFEHFVTFYANIFGVQKVKVMALKDVTAVRKAKTLGLPNAIEITHRGKVEFFTSFLVRRAGVVRQTRRQACIGGRPAQRCWEHAVPAMLAVRVGVTRALAPAVPRRGVPGGVLRVGQDLRLCQAVPGSPGPGELAFARLPRGVPAPGVRAGHRGQPGGAPAGWALLRRGHGGCPGPRRDRPGEERTMPCEKTH